MQQRSAARCLCCYEGGEVALLEVREDTVPVRGEELVERELKRKRSAELSCAELSAIASTFTFASRKRAVLVELYPKLHIAERPGFVDVLEAVFDFDFDRKDVMRDLNLG